jgi:all-trans-8'-apo-beta-carotenal 15,15'-oxygenase
MTSTVQRTQAYGWAKAIPKTAENAIACSISEFPLTPLRVLSGAIPPGLQGSLYRNGPARLARGNHQAGHWFDGDGAILGVHFTPTGATGTYRFIQTEGYQAEEKAGKLLFGGYGTMPTGAFWQRFLRDAKNAGNTAVLALPDKLLALWEGGKPHALNLQTLETLGQDDLGGLHQDLRYSAHPKRDPLTGEIYNFGMSYGKTGVLNVYRSRASGQIVKQTAIALEGLPMIHDFVVAGRYLIFFAPPVHLNPFPVLLRLKTYSESLTWQPQKGTQVLVVDRDSLELVSRSHAEPWYQWHFSNGYVDEGGSVVVDLVRYPDFQTNQYLQEITTGKTHTAAKGALWRLRLDPQSGQLLESSELLGRGCEFPVVHPQEVGQRSRFTYLSLHRRGVDISQELFGAIARYDHQTDTFVEADLGENRYPSEPVFAPDVADPTHGWVLTVVFDGNSDSSEVWVFDGDRLDDRPICRLALPSVIPLSFHGTWKPA